MSGQISSYSEDGGAHEWDLLTDQKVANAMTCTNWREKGHYRLGVPVRLQKAELTTILIYEKCYRYFSLAL